MFKMIAGTEKKKEVMNLAFHGLEGSMTFPSLNCAVGRGWWKEKFELPGAIFTFWQFDFISTIKLFFL